MDQYVLNRARTSGVDSLKYSKSHLGLFLTEKHTGSHKTLSFSQETFPFSDLLIVCLPGVEKLKLRAGGCRTSAVVTHISSANKIKHI